MAGMGPPPKPASQRRRTNAVPGTVHLPAEGRRGAPPAWPLASCTLAEDAAWTVMWATPQAVAWERMGAGPVRVVARYVRLLCVVESAAGGSDKTSVAQVQRAGEVRQLEDRLGLTPMAMLRLRWEIVPDEVADARADRPPAEPVRRFRAVE